MLDINLGNKTLIVGVLIALILSYGMVNFDSGAGTSQGVQGLERQAVYFNSNGADNTVPVEATEAMAQESGGGILDGASLSAIHQNKVDEEEIEYENRHDLRDHAARRL